jgi:hypothetical protein
MYEFERIDSIIQGLKKLRIVMLVLSLSLLLISFFNPTITLL